MRQPILFTALVFAACGTDTPDEDSTTDELASRKGADYAGCCASTHGLRANGYQFVARYLSHEPSKNLTLDEANALRAAGLDIVVVWEEDCCAALDGFGRGAEDARDALVQANALHEPSDRPIYFAIDFDASASDEGAINAYFDGAASVLGRDRVGAYAGFYPMRRLFDAGKIRYGWQTSAWSGGQWEPRAAIRQFAYDIPVAGVSTDTDVAVRDDYGQWSYRTQRPIADRIAMAPNAHGQLEVFFVDDNDVIQHAYQKEANGPTGWVGPEPLGGRAKSIALGTNADGRLELFYAGTNDRIYHNFQDAPAAGWHGEVALGGKAKQIAVGANADGRLELFYVGTNDAVYHNYQTDTGWSGERALGGEAKQLAVGANVDGHLELVYVGTNNRLYHNWQKGPNGAWHGQADFGGRAQQVEIARNADGRLDVLYIGTNDALYHNYETKHGPWSGEEGLGGKAKSIAVGYDDDGAIELFYAGTDDGIYHNYQHGPNGGWAGELGLAGKAQQLAAALNEDGRVELVYIGTNDRLYHHWQTAPNAGWSAEGSL